MRVRKSLSEAKQFGASDHLRRSARLRWPKQLGAATQTRPVPVHTLCRAGVLDELMPRIHFFFSLAFSAFLLLISVLLMFKSAASKVFSGSARITAVAGHMHVQAPPARHW